jgi:hypothetical protein
MAQAHTTFSGLFNDASCDPFLIGGSYDALLAPFNIDPNNNPTPQTVRQLIAATTTQNLPVALLALVEGHLTPLFLPFRRDRAMGVAEHPATDSKMFAFEGDLIGTQGYLVELTDDSFNLSARMTVPTVGHVRGLLAANLQVVTVGPFMDDDDNTLTLRTRYLVTILNKYAALFLAHPGGIPPRYYFDTILPVIKANGLGAACDSLTHFCLAAIMVPGTGQPLAVQVAAPCPPPRHIPLLEQSEAIFSNFLTGLCQIAAPEVNLQPLINTIVAGQQQQQQDQAIAHLDKELKESTSVSSWLGVENFARLLKYCGVLEEQELAPLWSILAKSAFQG